MTLDEFRNNKKLRDWAIQLFQSQEWIALMSAMERAHIRHSQLPILGADEVDCAKKLGMNDGFDLYQNTLLSAALTPMTVTELPSATFTDPLKEP